MPEKFTKTTNTKLGRNPKRGSYDEKTIHTILDQGFMAHIAYVIDGQPFVTPTLYWRENNYVYWHGSQKSRMLMTQAEENPVCFNMAFFDGFVMARSGFNHSANYRSVNIYGTPQNITDKNQKIKALDTMMEILFPGRLQEIRPHLDKEIKATKVLRLKIEEAVAKCRKGDPLDDEEDYDSVACWAGVVPAQMTFGKPFDDGRLLEGVELPDYLKNYYK